MSPDGPHIRRVLWKAHKAVEAVDRASIQATGLGLSDFAVLEALLHKGPLPVNVVGRKVLLTSGSISTAVERLARRGLVEKHRLASDGRVATVQLTEAGRKVIEAAYAAHCANLDTAAAALTSQEADTLVRLLKKIGRCAADLAQSGRIRRLDPADPPTNAP